MRARYHRGEVIRGLEPLGQDVLTQIARIRMALRNLSGNISSARP
jgi:hypothetical protein